MVANYHQKAISRMWDAIYSTTKRIKPKAILWLTSNDLEDPLIKGSPILQQIDWCMNEHPLASKLHQIKSIVGTHTRLIQCLCGWGVRHNAKKLLQELSSDQETGFYGFAKPKQNSFPIGINKLHTFPPWLLKGNSKNIQAIYRYYHTENEQR